MYGLKHTTIILWHIAVHTCSIAYCFCDFTASSGEGEGRGGGGGGEEGVCAFLWQEQ